MSAYETNTKGFNAEGQKTDKIYVDIKSSQKKRVIYIVKTFIILILTIKSNL